MYGLIIQLRSFVSAGWIVRSGDHPPWYLLTRWRPRQYGGRRRIKPEEGSDEDAQPHMCTNDVGVRAAHVRAHGLLPTITSLLTELFGPFTYPVPLDTS
jgi:hypothetical protein